ncbi:gamma-glutamyltransferase [Glaciecola sp. XM2]|jgi:gamma-glutamyltranspeptidase/glutathione hydrolase|uniref:gamma-glutamyltransferase n=1 Tax=Glaciecola sp. XM2 TaxID=1914931 RepID=UPI001BDF1DC0|nr:gamma-glutamyltransferase [Glaciecola sp. XM2]MBT1451016.1 gamma-glutamyltransferase [Glaciecola sp. XM2]
MPALTHRFFKPAHFLIASLLSASVMHCAHVQAQAVQSLQTGPVTSTATWSGRSTVYAPNAVAATSQPLATTAALDILQSGGNAFDAAVAAAAVLNVVEPYMTGMGGDMFAILWDAKNERLVGLDGSGRSGSKIDTQALAQKYDEIPNRGAVTVTVPGALAGWNDLVETYGKLSLAEVLAPAIAIAEQGFPVTPIIAQDWAGTLDVLNANEGAKATFLIDGKAPSAGQWFANPDLAETFRRIAKDGVDTFYGGELGQEIVAGLDELGGLITIDDLARHESQWVEPLSIDYKGYTLHELPPAGQGIAALQMLKMLENFDLSNMVHNSSEYLHTLIEAKKLAYADLARYVADPASMDVQPEALLSPDYLAKRAALIDPDQAMERAEPGSFATESDTIYLTVADIDGNMISLINSVSWYFGSGVVVPGTGVVLQNRGAGFTLEEGHPNQIAPNKRPFHTIIPAFVTRDGEPWVSYGVMSGSMQPQGHVQVLLNLIEFGMDPQEAVDAARFRHLNEKRIAVESLSPEVARALAAKGHDLEMPNGIAFGGAQLIKKLDRGWAAGSDPRKDGMAAGR